VAWPIRACQRRLTTPDRIIATLAARSRARWRRDVADAVPDIRAGVHSPLELRYVRDVERRHGLPRGDRQVPVIRGVTRQYIDVLYADYGVVVELDGVLAHPADGKSRDTRRDNANALDGYQTLRYGWTPVAYHACATALEVFSLLRRHGLRAPFRPCSKACATMTPESACGPPTWPTPARRAVLRQGHDDQPSPVRGVSRKAGLRRELGPVPGPNSRLERATLITARSVPRNMPDAKVSSQNAAGGQVTGRWWVFSRALR
jgi:very-short-patch-repair endonuclease